MRKFLLKHPESFEEIGNIGFWNVDGSSRRVDWSRGMELIYGMPLGSFKGTLEDSIQRIHPNDVARQLQESQQALDSKLPLNITFRIIRSDGKVRWVNTRGSARWGEDGSFLGVSGIQLDVTEQMDAYQTLRLQALVITNMAEGVAIVDAETGRVVHANQRLEQMLGYASGAMVGLHSSDVNANSDQDPVAVAQHILGELSKHGFWRGVVNNRCADGREIWTSCTVSEFMHEEFGRVWISVHADITLQRLAQQERDAALEHLRRLSANIQESMEAERTAVSRELHDELGAVLTGIHLRLDALAAPLGPKSHKLASALLAVAQDARIAQVSVRNICAQLRPLILDDMGLVEALRWYLEEWSTSSGVPVQCALDDSASKIDAKVATDMFRVTQELLTNVARHAHASKVDVSLWLDSAGLQLVLKDDGHGYDITHPTAGFGLMGVRERVRNQSGDLTVESGPTGTLVRVRMKSITVL